MRRLIQREIEDPLSMLIISGKVTRGDTIRVETRKGKLVIRRIAKEVPRLPPVSDESETATGLSGCEPSEACSKR